MTKTDEYTVEAKRKGYYVDKEGNIYSPNKKLALMKAQDRYKFTIRYFGKRVVIPVHRFVAYLKFGDKVFEGVDVRHLNSNSLDNSWDNIELGSHSDNMMDVPKERRIQRAIHASKKIRRFNDDEVKQILTDRENGMKYKDLCEKYNTSKSTLSYFFNNAQYI